MSKHKVPHPYSRADDNARSLNGVRDDDPKLFKAVFLHPHLIARGIPSYLKHHKPTLGHRDVYRFAVAWFHCGLHRR
jgi:predicted NAD/FAD-binding protein